MADLEHAAAPRRERHERFGLLQRGRDRLLDQHVEARFERAARHLEMRHRRNRDDRRVGRGEQLFRPGDSGHPQLAADRAGALEIAIGDAGQHDVALA